MGLVGKSDCRPQGLSCMVLDGVAGVPVEGEGRDHASEKEEG